MKLTAENYYSTEANEKYMSVSQCKMFQKCPACALAEISGEYKRETSTALLIGSYVDAYFEGTLDAFRTQHPEIFRRDGKPKAEYLHAETIIRRIERDKLMQAYLYGDKQVIMTGKIACVDVKIKVDVLHPERIVDLKIMKDFARVYTEGVGWQPWYAAWGYDMQGAVYREIVRQNTGKTLPFYLVAATKERVPDIDVLHIADSELDAALERFAAEIPLYHALKSGVFPVEGCGRCDWCKAQKQLDKPTESSDLCWE